MPDPTDAAAKQLANIEASTGKTVAEFVVEIRATSLEKHGQILKYFKTEHGLGHGNANLLAHVVRERIDGGPVSPEALLKAQYAGKKAPLFAIYERLRDVAQAQGDDVSTVIQKTGVSFRRSKQFALVQAPSSKRVQLGLNLDDAPAGDRVVPMKGMCTHKANLTAADDVDDEVSGWIRAAYERAG